MIEIFNIVIQLAYTVIITAIAIAAVFLLAINLWDWWEMKK
jgi:hypothetical protein